MCSWLYIFCYTDSMKITKLGHCCLIIEINGTRILTDPGAYSTLQNEVKNIDYILITHEHQDHFHIDSLRRVLSNNLNAEIFTNSSVGKLLEAENILYKRISYGESETVKGILIEGFGKEHAEIYKTFGLVENTGYFINNEFWYPGDSFHNPGKPVDILALPVAGPWMRIRDAIDYAEEIKPRVCFPVHDGMFQKDRGTLMYRLSQTFLPPLGIEFKVLEEGVENEF